ncbi:hypothetical protein ACVIW2_000132 [Bradyrhizobium huanghuaihaiense]
MRRLSMATRKELTAAVGERYRSGDRVEKARILDEFVNITGYHRKHAMRLLRGTMGREEVVGRSAGFTVKPNAMRSHSSGKRRTGFAASG